MDDRPSDGQRRAAVRLFQRQLSRPRIGAGGPDELDLGAARVEFPRSDGGDLEGSSTPAGCGVRPQGVRPSRFGSRDAISLAGELNPAANNRRQSRSWFDGGNPFGIPGLPSCIPSASDPTGSSCIAGDGLPQGDPLNPNPNGELVSPTDNLAFGTPIVTEFFDPNWAMGWGQKKANWEFSGSIQHELTEGVSMDVGYFRSTYVNFDEWDNRTWGPGDFDTYTVTVA